MGAHYNGRPPGFNPNLQLPPGAGGDGLPRPHPGFGLPGGINPVQKAGMKVGRNDPCHCGSGKKYKKCCLAKDAGQTWFEAAPGAQPGAEGAAKEPDWIEEAPASQEPEAWGEEDGGAGVEEEFTAASDDQCPPASPPEYPQPDENLPELPPEQAQIVEDWWRKTMPHYRKGAVDPLLQRVALALDEMPGLFPHLGLHEEFLFELGGMLGRCGRMPEFAALLLRVRREQRRMYSFCYGAYDAQIIAELALAGRAAEIPEYLDFFQEYPDAQPDYCHQICDLLAWRGFAGPLRLLCETTAAPLTTSSRVINGYFAMDWLVRLEKIPFLEGGDESSAAVHKTVAALKRMGERVGVPLEPEGGFLRSELRAYLEPSQNVDFRVHGLRARQRIHFNFLAYLRCHLQVPWLPAFFAADLVYVYWEWCENLKIPPCRLDKRDVSRYIQERSRYFVSIRGVVLMAAVQAIYWLADYLHAAGRLPDPEWERVKRECREHFLAGRKMVPGEDPAGRFCPTFDSLITVAPG